MVKRSSSEEKLAKLGQLENMPLSEEGTRLLISSLQDTNIIAAKAARIMAASGDERFIEPLIAAFNSLLDRPASDKNCWGKEAIADALLRLHCLSPEPFLRGSRHVQMEPVYGGQEDVAANLRGFCAGALARTYYPELHFELARLLVDPEPQPRRMAIRMLGEVPGDKSELLLRMKILSGDADPDILGECFTSLAAIGGESSLNFIAEQLHSANPPTAERAAIALGESRQERAFELLRVHWMQNADLEFNRVLFVAIGLTRTDAAFKFLLEAIEDGSRTGALTALEALDLYASDERRLEAIRAAVKTRKDSKVLDEFTRRFAASNGARDGD